MKRLFIRKLTLICLLTAFLLPAWGCAAPETPPPPPPAHVLSDLAVYGESALLTVNGRTAPPLTLRPADGGDILLLPGDTVDKGLPLGLLPVGEYSFYIEDEQLTVLGELAALEGYTLPREGIRKQWRFYTPRDNGPLLLTVEESDGLPDDWYDIYVDIGHGGSDLGATAYGAVEARENMLSGQYLAELLRGYGFKVCLSRWGAAVTGGPLAEDDPYVAGARVDKIYSSHACYVISNHLNADGSRPESGFQIYSSVRAGLDWAQAIARQWQELGWYPNNHGLGLVGDGLYQRRLDDKPESRIDHYFILRETGGEALSPERYRAHQPGDPDLRKGAQAILLEYAFLDNRSDMAYWRENYQKLVRGVCLGSLEYWQINAAPAE